MTTRRLPVLPTLLVLIAVGVMVRLGLWQLDRLHQKEALLVRYTAAQARTDAIVWNGHFPGPEMLMYRRVTLDCGEALADQPVSGRNSQGIPGWVQVATCSRIPVRIVLGWSKGTGFIPGASDDARLMQRWHGGMVSGWLAPGPRLVADPPLAGLAANMRPDPREIPNNHLSYAVQWFLFALTATVIYALALRGRWKKAG